MDSVGRRAKESRKLLLAGVFVNLVLALTKIAGGLFGRSHALIADGIESSLDMLSSVMMWGAIKYAERPPDSDHPYGHGKMESLAAVAGSLLLIMAGAALGLHSIREIFLLQRSADLDHTPAGFTLAVLGATIVLKEGLFRWLVAGESTVREGHDIAHSVKNRFLDGDFHLADVVVHIEPEARPGLTRA